MTRKSPPQNAPQPPAEGPAWFDRARHYIGTFGIHDRATGALLDGAGEPVSPAVRRLAAPAASQED